MKFKYKLIYFIYNVLLKKNYPCGRTKKDKHLCCHRPINIGTCYLSEDKKSAYCKYCNHIRMLSSVEIDIENIW